MLCVALHSVIKCVRCNSLINDPAIDKALSPSHVIHHNVGLEMNEEKNVFHPAFINAMKTLVAEATRTRIPRLLCFRIAKLFDELSARNDPIVQGCL